MPLDWITVCGIIAGLTGFARSVYYILFVILDKIHQKLEKKKEKVMDDKKYHQLPGEDPTD